MTHPNYVCEPLYCSAMCTSSNSVFIIDGCHGALTELTALSFCDAVVKEATLRVHVLAASLFLALFH